jgi:hypothetical protein
MFILPHPFQKASFLRVFGKINNPAGGGVYSGVAERGGFEPPVRRKANNGFRDRRIRPLCHLSYTFSRIYHGVNSALAEPSLLRIQG